MVVAVVLIVSMSFSWDRALGLVWLLHFDHIPTLLTFIFGLFATLHCYRIKLQRKHGFLTSTNNCTVLKNIRYMCYLETLGNDA